MIGMPVRRHEIVYTCCPDAFPDVSFWVVMRRYDVIIWGPHSSSKKKLKDPKQFIFLLLVAYILPIIIHHTETRFILTLLVWNWKFEFLFRRVHSSWDPKLYRKASKNTPLNILLVNIPSGSQMESTENFKTHASNITVFRSRLLTNQILVG